MAAMVQSNRVDVGVKVRVRVQSWSRTVGVMARSGAVQLHEMLVERGLSTCGGGDDAVVRGGQHAHMVARVGGCLRSHALQAVVPATLANVLADRRR